MAKKPKKSIKSKPKKSSSSPNKQDDCPDGVCPIKKPKSLSSRLMGLLFGSKDS